MISQLLAQLKASALEWFQIEMELKKLEAIEALSRVTSRLFKTSFFWTASLIGLIFGLIALSIHLETKFEIVGIGWLITAGSIFAVGIILKLFFQDTLQRYFERKILELFE